MVENISAKQVLGIKLSDWLTSILSSYGRRMMEDVYDKVSKTGFFEKMKNQSDPVKYCMEAANNALVAFLDQKVGEETPLKKIFKEIFMDSSSELNKRLINGESAKKIISEEAKKENMNSTEKDFLEMLLSMDDEKIESFLKWILKMSEEERLKTIEILQKLSEEDFSKFASAGDEIKELILESIKKPKKKLVGKVFRELLKRRAEKRRANRNE